MSLETYLEIIVFLYMDFPLIIKKKICFQLIFTVC